MNRRHSPAPTASPLDVLGASLVLLAAVAFGLIRVQAANLPWHMAVARVASTTGHWPVTNTFSYTFPSYPMFQQYPAFQWVLWATFRAAGWGALTVLSCAGWVAVLIVFVRWAGTFGAAAVLHPIWMLGCYALQRRMILRPDLFTMLALGAELLALDAYARGRTRAIALVPALHLFWVNSHQLFPLSFVVQGLFIVHVEVQRRYPWLRDDPEAPPARTLPLLLALGASALLTFATPLGARILDAPPHTAQSLSLFRDVIPEFRPIWKMPFELALAILTALPAAYAFYRTRRRPHLFDLGVWLLSLAMALAAVRGLMFLGVVSIAVFQRCLQRGRAAGIAFSPSVGPTARSTLKVIGFAFSCTLAANVVYYRWVRPPLLLGGTQPGFGRSVGGWAEDATTFLRRDAPPGRMLNLNAALGDDVIFWVAGVPVFYDSRFESYPAEFLREVVAADGDDARLDGLIRRFDVQWAALQHARGPERARAVHLLRAGWAPVYVDSGVVVLVNDRPETRAYIQAHRIDLAGESPRDLVRAPLALRAQQRACFARLMRALALDARVEEQRSAAAFESGADGVAAFAEL